MTGMDGSRLRERNCVMLVAFLLPLLPFQVILYGFSNMLQANRRHLRTKAPTYSMQIELS